MTYKNGVVGNDYKLQLDKNSDIDYLVFFSKSKKLKTLIITLNKRTHKTPTIKLIRRCRHE